MRRRRCASAALAPPDRRYQVDVWGFGGDIGAVGHGTVEIGNPAVVGEPDEGSLLDVHFGEHGHGVLRLVLRSGMVRLVPRGMFSTSH